MELSTWVQMGAAVVQAAAAVIVVRLTRRLVDVTSEYVTLTRDLAAAARAGQLAHAAERARDVARFRALLTQLREQVHRLPGALEQGEQIRRAALWTASELDDFGELGAVIGFAGDAAKVVGHLRRVAEHAHVVKDNNPRVGINWREFPWDDYAAHRRDAVDLLDRLSVTRGELEPIGPT